MPFSPPVIRAAPLFRAALCLGAVAMLSACASKPQISAQQESGQYLSRASRTYAAPGPASDPWGPYITEAAAKYDVPDRWIREVMRQESGGKLYGRNGNLITSGAGAMGLMQVMPGTYDELRTRYPELGDDPFDPHNNILAGAAYIREMYDIFGSPGFLAAYNAGPGRLDDHLTRNRTLPEETRRYVASIGPRISGYEPNKASPGAQYAMNALPLQIPDGPRYPAAQYASAAAQYASAAVSYTPPVQFAQADTAPRTPIVLNPVSEPYVPSRSMVAQRPAIQLAALPKEEAPPALSWKPEPPAQRLTEIAQLPEPPAPRASQLAEITPLRPSRLSSIGQLPEPPRPPAAQYAALQPLTPRHGGFQLVSSANAAPVVHRGAAVGGTPGGWAVQVGAFNNPSLASSATASARGQVPDVLGNARPAIAGVRQGSGTLYRARLTGLSRESAAHACERLARARTTCMIVSPDAQS